MAQAQIDIVPRFVLYEKENINQKNDRQSEKVNLLAQQEVKIHIL